VYGKLPFAVKGKASILATTAVNPGSLRACVREDLMDLLIERNQLG
jgi:hypothetical protein